MLTSTSVMLVSSKSRARYWSRVATAAEVLLVYAGILLYIWRWQYSHPRWWAVLLAIILASHLLHRDSLSTLGLGIKELRPSAEALLPLALVALFLPLVIYGVFSHHLTFVWPAKQSLVNFIGYGTWSCFQEYLTQSYFHNRLMQVIRSRHLSSLVTALMFSSAHIPNPVLVIATLAGGFLFSETFAHHRNIWPLALAHAAGGLLIAAVFPPALIHNMRVGPGYYSYGVK